MNWAEFFDLGGRGTFIWSAFGAFLLALVLEVLWVRARVKRVEAALKDERLADATSGSRK